MSRELLMAGGFWLISAGTSGYERYMLQGDLTSACIDLVVSFFGIYVLARNFPVTVVVIGGAA